MNHSPVIRRRAKTWTEAPGLMSIRPRSVHGSLSGDHDDATAATLSSSSMSLQSVPPGEYVYRNPQRRHGNSAASYTPRIAPPPLRRDYGYSAMTTINHATNGGGGGRDVSGEKQDMLQWINSALIRGSQEPVTNVEAAMADGLTLARLARVLVGEEPPNLILHPSMFVQRVENLQVCLSWLREKGVPLPNVHVEDLASGNAKSGLALCKALCTYDISHHEGMGSSANLDKDDVAMLGWLGAVVEEDITSYQALSDGHVLCKLFRKMAPRCLDEDLSNKSAQERLDCALSAAETNLSISRGLLDTRKLAQAKEDSYKLFSYLQRCQITYKQLRRQEFMRLEKERSAANRIPPPSPLPSSDVVGGRVPFGLVDQSKRMYQPERALATAKASPMAVPEPSFHGRSSSPGRSAEQITQRANRVQQAQRNQAVGSEGREQSPPFTIVKGSTPTSSSGSLSSESSGSRSSGGPKVYPPPYEPPPPPPPSTSGGEQHPHHSSLPSPSLLPKGPSIRPKGSSGLGVSAQHSPLLAQHRSSGENGITNGERQSEQERGVKDTCPEEDPTAGKSEDRSRAEPVTNTASNGYPHQPPSHPPPPLPKTSDRSPPPSEGHPTQRQNPRYDETDAGPVPTPLSILSQHLQSSSSPHHVQSHFLSRLELMEHELAEVRERLDTERVQFSQKVQEIAIEEEKRRKELEKEFKKLAEVARQLSKHYDTCFVNLARQIAHVQDKLGMESEDTIGALVGDTYQEEGKSLDTKQLIQEISSLKEQMQTIIIGPAGSLPTEPGSKDPEEELRRSSGSSPPSSLPITPEPMMTTPDITLQGTEGLQKKLFVRKGKKMKKEKEKQRNSANISPSPSSSSLVELAHSAKITHANHKKLSKFFGEDLPKVENLQTFLKGLGFPELLPKFSKEQVTLNELQLMTEQHLIELGIPMGPRLAILSEIQFLESVSVED